MKRILFSILFLLSCVFGFSQSFSNDPSDAFFRNADKPLKESSITKNNKESYGSEFEWKHIDLSSDCCVLKHIDGSQYFAGKVKKKNYVSDGKLLTSIVRTGVGVLKIISNEGIKYIYGSWERDFLSGDSLVKDTDGSVYFCKWRFGKKIKNSQREATEEEKTILEENIDSFEAQIRISGL